MDRATFTEMVESEFGQLLKLLEQKGNDYAGNEDVLANFKRNADRLGLEPQQVLGVYMNKHLDAIFTYIREGEVHSEPIEGRIHDAINYLLLLLAMVREQDDFYERNSHLVKDV